MKILSASAHGFLDYLFSVFLLASPMLFKMDAPACTIAYVLGGVHFLLTVITDFPLGLLKKVPFRIHGLIELIVAVLLIGLSVWFRDRGNDFAFYYYLCLSAVILLVFVTTDYRNVNK